MIQELESLLKEYRSTLEDTTEIYQIQLFIDWLRYKQSNITIQEEIDSKLAKIQNHILENS